MTHDQKLDAILNAYLYGQLLKLSNDPTYHKLTFALVVSRLAPDTESWELDFLRNRLLEDGYLKFSEFGDGEPMELTPKGIAFRQTSGYEKQRLAGELDNEIKIRTLKSLRQSTVALWISILSMIGTVATTVFSLLRH
ncbi:MAG: hypothetical protein K9J06_13695 [Flavobacteriales bacterium]|nr:hypothetical protein [Flavobacteriales bacterium]